MPKTLVRGTVSQDIATEIKRVSSERGVSVSAFIERALDAYLNEIYRRKDFNENDSVEARKTLSSRS